MFSGLLDNGATVDQVFWFVSKAMKNIDDEFRKSVIILQILTPMSKSRALPEQVY